MSHAEEDLSQVSKHTVQLNKRSAKDYEQYFKHSDVLIHGSSQIKVLNVVSICACATGTFVKSRCLQDIVVVLDESG